MNWTCAFLKRHLCGECMGLKRFLNMLVVVRCAVKKTPYDFPLYFLLYRDPYNGLL